MNEGTGVNKGKNIFLKNVESPSQTGDHEAAQLCDFLSA